MVEVFSNTLVVGALSLSIAVLSLGIYEITGSWPSDLGRWGVALFVLFGLVFVGVHLVVGSTEPSSGA